MRDRRWRALASHWIAVASAAWITRYATLAVLPWRGVPLWLPWFDQSRYFRSATAFAHADLLPDMHWYPLGYPLAAAPFVWLLPNDPFFLLDLVLFLLTCRAFQGVAARLGIARWPATLCFLGTTLVDTKVAGGWAQPWTTTLSATVTWCLIDRLLDTLDRPLTDRRARDFAIIGALATGLPLVRPVDALLGVTCAAVLILTLLHRRQPVLRPIGAACLGGVAVAFAYGALHFAIYGLHPTPYMIAAADTGFVWSDFGWKAYVLLVHARPWFPDTQAILERLPWIVPGCAGLIAAAITGPAGMRLAILLLFAALLSTSAIMLTYADLQPPGLWLFGNIHYFKWTLPAFGAGLILGWRQMGQSRERGVFAAALVLLLLPLGIRVAPAAVSDATPARMLRFAGDTHRPWDEAYFAPVTITDDNGALTNIGGFHQIPDGSGERAIAISRLFAGHPHRTDPGEGATMRHQPPYSRYGERLTYLGF